MTKNQRRRMKKKALKHAKRMGVHEGTVQDKQQTSQTPEKNTVHVEIEYVSQDLSAQFDADPSLKEFSKVFEKFSSAEELCQERTTQDEVGRIVQIIPAVV